MKVAIFQFSMFGINTYVVYDQESKCCAVIDPGMSSEEEEKAMDLFIKKNELKVTHIINTHLHIDHVVGDAYMKELYAAPIYAHKDDEDLGQRIRHQAEMFGIRKPINDIEISEYLNDGDTIKIGDGELLVISVPGHSRGSIALYDKKDGFVIVGDALFNGSIGRTDLPGGNYAQLIDSIKNKLLALPDDTIVYPGHGPATTIGREKRSNPFLVG